MEERGRLTQVIEMKNKVIAVANEPARHNKTPLSVTSNCVGSMMNVESADERKRIVHTANQSKMWKNTLIT
jgi:hypothetical protein